MRRLVLFFIASLALTACVSEGERQRMQQLLCEAETMNFEYVPMDTVEFMDEVLGFFMSHGTRDERIRANYMMGCVYRDRGDSPMALQYYLEAANQADTTTAGCDFAKIGRIYGQMAMLFHQQRYPQKELEMWDKAADLALKAGDTLVYIQSHHQESWSILMAE